MSRKILANNKAVSGTKEWASHNVNCYNGCRHDCLYCYARGMAVRFGRMRPEEWANEKPRLTELQKKRTLLDGGIMFPTTHDINPNNLFDCLVVLGKLILAGNKVLVVSKPHLPCIETMCRVMAAYKQQILFRFSIGLMDDELRAFWEPGAPSFNERLDSLRHAFETGYETSVSAEPLLEPWSVKTLVDRIRPFVSHSIWIGKANQLRQRTSWKLPADHPEIVRLLSWQTDEKVLEIYKIFKDDPLIRWKDSYKKVIGLDRPDTPGLDI